MMIEKARRANFGERAFQAYAIASAKALRYKSVWRFEKNKKELKGLNFARENNSTLRQVWVGNNIVKVRLSRRHGLDHLEPCKSW